MRHGSPDAKPLPKAPQRVPKASDAWRPNPFEAEFRERAFVGGGEHWRSGFVLAHSCGLSLVLPSEDGEWAHVDPMVDPWHLTHTTSGRGFGWTLSFKRAVQALRDASVVDWTKETPPTLSDKARRIGLEHNAKYGKGYTRDDAKRRLAA